MLHKHQDRANLLWPESKPKTMIKTPVMNMVTSRVECRRSASSMDFYRLEFSPWVNVIARTPEDRLVMIRQYRFGSGQLEWEIPGGSVDPGEDPLHAGLRELLEETGYAGNNSRLIGKVCPNPAIQDNFCYTVLVEEAIKISEPRPEDMEDIEVHIMDLQAVQNLVVSRELNHGLVLNALMFYRMYQDLT